MRLYKKTKKNKKVTIICIILFSFLCIIFSVLTLIIFPNAIKESTKANNSKTTEITVKKTNNIKSEFDKSQYSTTDPNSIWIIVNKTHPLSPIDYAPDDLVTINGATIRSIAKANFNELISAAQKSGVPIYSASSYRSYETQKNLYNSYASTYGQTSTDTFSARPGYSEHQTGLAIDFGDSNNSDCNFDDCFADTATGKWLATNAAQYGFILRYTSSKQSITGYKYEPWHYRYVGTELAAEMKAQSVETLEEFFNISGGESYL